ncbi:MAG: DUF1858 domain-containing protein [bacterium]
MQKQTEKKIAKITISPDSFVREVIGVYPETAPVFLNYDLHCAGCPMAGPETLNDVASIHGVDIKELINDLKKTINKKTK